MNNFFFQSRAAEFWTSSGSGTVRCELCPKKCVISENETGYCGARRNLGGILAASSYGKVSAIALDPIEKKPLNMFHPGTKILSIGGIGCNFSCPFCQNSDISIEYEHALRTARQLSPGDVFKLASDTVHSGNIGVAYTYNEPLIGYEFLYDCAKLIHAAGMHNIIVTNGYICPAPLEALLPLTAAMNIDLKGLSSEFYNKVGGDPQPVMETIKLAAKHCHVEVTTLVIPGENECDIENIAKWLACVNPAIPLHLSRFFPRYKYSGKSQATRETMQKLQKTAEKFLENVYLGNM